jgi:hypothetical protein
MRNARGARSPEQAGFSGFDTTQNAYPPAGRTALPETGNSIATEHSEPGDDVSDYAEGQGRRAPAGQIHSAGRAAPLFTRPHRPISAWRQTLLGGSAASALLFAMGMPAFANCATAGTTMDCSGNLPDPIRIDETSDVNTLNLSEPDADIRWDDGNSGIRFISNRDVTINSNTGAHAIVVSGEGADGIKAQSYEDGDVGAIGIDHTGNVSAADGFGIWAETDGDISLTVDGDVAGGLDAIKLHSTTDGTVTIDVTGGLASTGGDGLTASTNGAITSTTVGDIEAAGGGIVLQSYESGAIGLSHTGDIEAGGGHGIYASGNGAVTATTEGDIRGKVDAIHLEGHGGDVLLDHTGELTADEGYGVYADAVGEVTVGVDGTVDAGGTGIYARSAYSSVTIDHWGGSLTARTGDAIVAKSPNATVSVTNTGNIDAQGFGIYAETGTGLITISQTGTLQSHEGKGIHASSGGGSISITKTGTVTAELDAVTATSGGGSVGITQTGDVKSFNGKGILATSSGASATVSGSGSVTSKGDAITASGSGGVTINRTGGAIESWSGSGIVVDATGSSASITNAGTIAAYQDGIRAVSSDGVTINQAGAITASHGAGVWANPTTGGISVTTSGAIESKKTAIHAKTSGGDVTISQTGTVTSNAGKGIDTYTPDGAITIGTGAVIAQLDGITATNEDDSKVEITSAGVTSYDGAGILASSATGIVKVTNNGAVTSQLVGIKATNLGGYTVSVEQNGDLTSYSADGITVWSSTGQIDVTGSGSITAELSGIVAGNEGTGTITIDRSGDITAYKGSGIVASSTDGEISIESEGSLIAELDGIVATNEGDANVAVVQTGNLTAYKGSGIIVSSANGELIVSSTGTLAADRDGIVATNIGDGNVSVFQDGALTANTGTGVVATSSTGEVTVTTIGALIADLDGIVATNAGDTAVSVTAGAVTANKGSGIVATSTTGEVTVTGNGAIIADLDGIIATNEGLTTVEVMQTGDVTASQGSGIVATSSLGAIVVTSAGNILADDYGINAVNSSDDGAITIGHTGDVTATNFDGIYAETANADIDVTVDGDVTAGQDAIHLVSYGNQDVTIAGGTLSGGAGFAGVHFDGGHENSLLNGGSITSVDGINGLAVFAHDSNTAIVNNGSITGNVVLSDWTNSFDNGLTGNFTMGDTVHLGAGNTLTNDGVVSVGEEGVVASTTLTGSFVNSATGTFKLDIDLAGSTADHLAVSGSASLSGSLGLHFTTLGVFDQTFTVLSAADVSTGALSVSNPLVQYAINAGDGENLDLTVAGYDYVTSELNGNGQSFGTYLNGVIGHDGVFDPIGLALLNLTTMEEVNEAYGALTPESHLNEQLTATYNSLGFANSLMSCRVRDGAYVFNAEGECAWGRIGYRMLDRDTTADTVGFDRDTWELAGGAQYAVKDDYRVGFAFAASTSKTNGADGSTSDGKQIEGGVVLKYVPGPLTLSGSLSGSYGWYDAERTVAFADFSEDLTSSPQAGSLNARLRAAYDFGNDSIYLRPQIEGNATYLYQQAYSETGGIAAMAIDSVSRTVFSAAPAVEVGGQVVTTGGTMLRPYVRGGVTVFSNDSYDLTARFAADTLDADSFTLTSSSDRLLWNTSAGIDILFENRNTVRAFYDGNFGQTSSEHAFGLKASHDF